VAEVVPDLVAVGGLTSDYIISVEGTGMLVQTGENGDCNWYIYDGKGNREEDPTDSLGSLAKSGFLTNRLSLDELDRWRTFLAKRVLHDEVIYSYCHDHNTLTATQVHEAAACL
jgi:hypothetical protein